MYKYVSKAKIKEPRKIIESIILVAQDYLRENYGVTFQFKLIGSASRHFVTKNIDDEDSNFDFDYNLIVQNQNDYTDNKIKSLFDKSFKIAIDSYNKKVNKDEQLTGIANSKSIMHFETKNIWYFASDLVILLFDGYDDSEGIPLYKMLKQINQGYVWNERNYYYDVMKYNELIENNYLNDLRTEYLNLKNINEGNEKKSHSLFLEAINNVYNQNWE